MNTSQEIFKHLGLNSPAAKSFLNGPEPLRKDFERDSSHSSQFWISAQQLLDTLPSKSQRNTLESSAVELIFKAARAHRDAFLSLHSSTLYDELTHQRTRFLRLDELLSQAALKLPGLVPSESLLGKEQELIQSQKEGHEIDQGIFLSHVLSQFNSGMHLCHAMLLEHPQTAQYREEFMSQGRLELPGVSLKRDDQAVHLTFQNGKYLHAEDDTTLTHTEIAADLAIGDPHTSIAVMRGGIVPHGKYQNERVFCSGINLTRLYNGKIPYLFYIERDMGIVNKIFRGLAYKEHTANDMLGQSLEKLWIAVIDRFAIGGGCQYLLVTDINIAADNAYMTLPARKEGIIPGVANMRLPRFVGDRMARQAIMMERRIDCQSDMGRMICDEVVQADQLESTLAKTIETISSSGVVSASGNRRAFRVALEPLDLFRQYMSVYAKEQALCHFSPALISNLEKNWDAHNRKLKN